MALREEFEKSGNFLFRWRSYLPLLTVPLGALALKNFQSVYINQHFDRIWELTCLTVSFLGIFLRIFTVASAPRGTSGRNTKSQVAESLNSTGIYSVVRHPLYLGNFLIYFGILASLRSWWFVSVGVLVFWVYYERIMFAEEEFLRRKFGESYTAWADPVPAFFPHLRNWQRPAQPPNFLAGLGSEYASFFLVVSFFALFDVAEESLVKNQLAVDRLWIIIFIGTFIFYLLVRLVKKSTKILNKA